MREADAQVGQPLHDAGEQHRAHRGRRLGRHPDQPAQPVPLQPVAAHHVPRVHEDGGAQVLGGLEEGVERGVAEVHAVRVGADLHAGQAELADAALELRDGEVGRLQRHRAEAGEARRVVADDAGEVLVEEAREVGGVLGLGPVAEHHGHRREHLHVDAVPVGLRQPHGAGPRCWRRRCGSCGRRSASAPSSRPARAPAAPSRRSRSAPAGRASCAAGCACGGRRARPVRVRRRAVGRRGGEVGRACARARARRRPASGASPAARPVMKA